MRKAFDGGWLVSEKNGQFMGINFGADFCAEHEWGIADLKRLLGVTEESNKLMGIEKRRVKVVNPATVALVEHGDVLSLVIDSPYSVKSIVENFDLEAQGKANKCHCEWRMGKDDTLLTLWSGGDCAVRVRGDENKARLRELHQALLNGDAAMWVGGGGVFKNGGLCIAIISKVDDESKQVMYNADQDRVNLNAAAEKTGIKKKIEAYNEQWRKNYEVETGGRCYESPPCGFFALTPKWGTIDGKKTKHPVTFWLNPMRQDENNYGWFTVEELEQWLQGKGPIPMKSKVKS